MIRAWGRALRLPLVPAASRKLPIEADIEIQAREILSLRTKMNELYAKHTGQPVEQIERDMDRDRYMSADEAKTYGIIDSVFSPHRDPVVPDAAVAAVPTT